MEQYPGRVVGQEREHDQLVIVGDDVRRRGHRERPDLIELRRPAVIDRRHLVEDIGEARGRRLDSLLVLDLVAADIRQERVALAIRGAAIVEEDPDRGRIQRELRRVRIVVE